MQTQIQISHLLSCSVNFPTVRRRQFGFGVEKENGSGSEIVKRD